MGLTNFTVKENKMGLITINKSTELDRLINLAASKVSLMNMIRFKANYDQSYLNQVPPLSNCSIEVAIDEISKVLIHIDVKLGTYKAKAPWSSVKAYTTGKNIMFNTRKIHTLESIVNTIVHELTHIASGSNNNLEFGHGTGPSRNYNQDKKQGCMPQLLGRTFSEWVLNDESSDAA